MDLYHPFILKHNNSPVHFEKMEGADIIVEAYNAICGDQFKIYLKLDNDFINKISFHGYGCAVSKASTSMLVDLLEGLRVEEGMALINQFLVSFHDEIELIENGIIEELQMGKVLEVLKVSKKYPGREKCATLSWDSISKQLIS